MALSLCGLMAASATAPDAGGAQERLGVEHLYIYVRAINSWLHVHYLINTDCCMFVK